MSKHTPGPWRYDPSRVAIVAGPEDDPVYVIVTRGAMGGEDVRADIALMVAAPELLSAARGAVEALAGCYYPGGEGDKAYRRLCDAIVACGRTP
jgi:hypothetical protein